jgi:mutator protein MutT
MRELREELGIEVRVGELIETIEHDYGDKRVLLKFFRCQWLGNEPQSLGCPAFEWISRHDFGGYRFPAADDRLVEKLRSNNDLWR